MRYDVDVAGFQAPYCGLGPEPEPELEPGLGRASEPGFVVAAGVDFSVLPAEPVNTDIVCTAGHEAGQLTCVRSKSNR